MNMEHENKKSSVNLRSLWLTMALCAVLLAAAADLAFGTQIIGMIALMGAAGIFTVILLTCETYVSVLDGVVSLVILYFAGGMTVVLPALGAVFIVCAFVLSRLIKKKCSKTSAVVALTIVLLLYFLILAAVLYAAGGHSLAPKDVMRELNSFFDEMRSEAADWGRAYVDELPEQTIKLYENLGVGTEELRESYAASAEAAVDAVQMFLPGEILLLLQVLAYLGVCFFVLAVKQARYEALLPEPRWVLYPTQVTCIVFMVTTFVYMIASFFSGTTAFAVVCVNLLLALWPSMAACGVRGLVVRLKHPVLRGRTIFILGLFVLFGLFMLNLMLPIAAILLAFLGARDVSSLRMAEAEANKKKK